MHGISAEAEAVLVVATGVLFVGALVLVILVIRLSRPVEWAIPAAKQQAEEGLPLDLRGYTNRKAGGSYPKTPFWSPLGSVPFLTRPHEP